MSVHEQAAAAVLSQLFLAADGALLGLGLAYVAVRSILKFTANSSALRKIEQAPSIHVSDLRSVLTLPSANANNANEQSNCEKLVIVRGTVEAKSAVDGHCRSGVLASQESGDKGVILQRSQTCIRNEWRGFFGWTSNLRSLFVSSWKEQESSTVRMVPFILVDGGRLPQSAYVIVNMEGSRHPLPLTTVYRHLQPVNASPYTFLQALFGHEYPVGLLDEEKLLPLGKEITAVGICSLKDGTLVMKSCEDLPFFLSDMTKDQMLVDLDFKNKVLFCSGIVLGSLAVGILGYVVVRNWNRWKEWRQRRQAQQQSPSPNNDVNYQGPVDDEIGDVPDGELCVICLMRRRRSAFVPCGHLVCCQSCASSVKRGLSPKCPVCRQAIRDLMRIYD
ncbi:hypothetical protein ACH5RR_024335 [Cinchona calisaya]|uniref:RING-type E3 ubiquitin transferase n=1 Tax=Cinchona calisaya TaxID=153742 RepID=A0ABD2YWE8_9GENT